MRETTIRAQNLDTRDIARLAHCHRWGLAAVGAPGGSNCAEKVSASRASAVAAREHLSTGNDSGISGRLASDRKATGSWLRLPGNE